MSADTNPRLGEAIAGYLEAVERGHSPDRDAFLRLHPEIADELAAFLADHDQMNRIAAPFHLSDPNVTVDTTAAAEALVPTVRYFGDYELLGEIARGGMGVVFLARQSSLNRTVALKMILSGALAGPADVQRFRAEAEAAAHLDHRHIVPIYEVGEHEGQQYFTMKRIDGPNLAAALHGEAWEPRRAARLLADVARAVHYAHQRGLLHRDIKPANILIDADGCAYVTDFGLAKKSGTDIDLTQTGALLGTPKYMAPEQASSSRGLTTAADVYSLGAVLFEALTGRPPFTGDSVVELLDKVRGTEPPPLRAINAKVPRDLETVCLKCLAKEPTKRYESAGALADDLERFLAGEPVRARRVGAIERGAMWAKRNPAVAALALGVILSTIFGSFMVVRQTLRTQREWDRAEKVNADLTRANAEAVDATRLAERSLYGAQILLAQATLDKLQIGQARRALDQTDAALRGWEWRFLGQSSDASSQTFPVRAGATNVLRFATDGKSLVWSNTHDGIGRLDLDHPGREYPRFGSGTSWSRSGGDPVPNIAFTADHAYLAYHTQTGLHLWKMAPGDGWATPIDVGPRRESQGFDAFMGAVAFSADGLRLYSAASKRLCCYDRDTRKELWSMPIGTDQAWSLAVTADEKRAAVGFPDDKMVHVYDLVKREQEFATAPHLNTPDYAAFSPDGKRLFTHCAFRNPRVWDLETKKQLVRNDEYWASAFAPSFDGKLGVMGMSSGDVVIFDAVTGKDIRTMRGHNAMLHVVAFSPDGSLVASGGRDKAIRVWEVKTGKLLRTLVGHTGTVETLVFSPDGRTIASGTGGDSLKLWNLDDVPPTRHLDWPVRGSVWWWDFLADGRRLLTSGHAWEKDGPTGFLHVWDADTGKIEHTFRHGEQVDAFSLSADEKWLVTGAREGTVKLWDFAARKEVRNHWKDVPPEERTLDGAVVRSVAMHPSGAGYAAGLGNGTLVVWSRETGAESWRTAIRQPKEFGTYNDRSEMLMAVNWLRFTPDGRHLIARASYGDDLFVVYDAATGGVVWQSRRVSRESRWALTPDGRWFAYGTEDRSMVTLFDFQTGERSTFGPFENPVSALAITADGKRIAIGSSGSGWNDSSIELWDRESGTKLRTIRGHESLVSSLAFLPGGGRLVSGSLDHTVKLWDPESGQELLSLTLDDEPDNRVEHVLVSPDGRRIVATDGFPDAGSGGGSVTVWQAK